MSAKILTRVRTWIASSSLSEGDRLPPERELCSTLGVSRAELRKCFLVLEAEGSLARQVGRGTFLAKKSNVRASNTFEKTVADLAERTGPREAMVARLAIEPELARLAAFNASPRQLRDLRQLAGNMRTATSWLIYEEMDSRFHDTLAAASGNSLLHELHKILNGVRFVVVWRRLNTSEEAPQSNYHSFAEHEAIVSALEQRSGDDAYAAMSKHLQSTLSSMTVSK